jgi:chemotaxis protein MotA
MDLATVFGLVLGFSLMALAVFLAPGASFGALIDYPSILIVVGGALASVLVCFPLRALFGMRQLVKTVFFNKPENLTGVIDELVSLAETARRDGLLALELRMDGISHPFITLGVQLAVDGTRPEVLEEILRIKIDALAARHRTGKNIVDQLAKFGPAYGLIGTLLGLIFMLGRLNDPETLGPGMAVALVTTLYGAVMANMVMLPFSEKLAHLNREELTAMELILRGILAIQSGENPRIIEQKLSTFVPDRSEPLTRKAA